MMLRTKDQNFTKDLTPILRGANNFVAPNKKNSDE